MTKGFTLLEVMIAVALMAIALVTLIGSQSQSVAVMNDVRFETSAGHLAREIITEVRLTDFDQLTNTQGSFDKDFEDFVWELEVDDISGAELGIDAINGMLKRVTVVITHREDIRQRFSVQTILSRKPVKSESN